MTDTLTDQIVWKCQGCGQPVEDGTGGLHVDVMAAMESERALAEFHRTHAVSVITAEMLAVMDQFPPAPWHAWHLSECTPENSEGPYWIEVERIRTAWDALKWCSHLMDKNWLAATDWSAVMDVVSSKHEYGPLAER